jgi:hypothetical protein
MKLVYAILLKITGVKIQFAEDPTIEVSSF